MTRPKKTQYRPRKILYLPRGLLLSHCPQASQLSSTPSFLKSKRRPRAWSLKALTRCLKDSNPNDLKSMRRPTSPASMLTHPPRPKTRTKPSSRASLNQLSVAKQQPRRKHHRHNPSTQALRPQNSARIQLKGRKAPPKRPLLESNRIVDRELTVPRKELVLRFRMTLRSTMTLTCSAARRLQGEGSGHSRVRMSHRWLRR